VIAQFGSDTAASAGPGSLSESGSWAVIHPAQHTRSGVSTPRERKLRFKTNLRYAAPVPGRLGLLYTRPRSIARPGGNAAVGLRAAKDCSQDRQSYGDPEIHESRHVDPVFLDKSYHMLPDGEIAKPSALLREAMKKRQQYAIATVAMHNREHIVAIRPSGNELMLHTMFFVDEIQ